MTTKIFISSVILFTLASCSNNRTKGNPEQETPKALEDKSSSYEFVSKRGYDDLIENLYKELVSKSVDLKQLEDRINELNKSKADTTELFDKFNEKNQYYFSSAEQHLSAIKDSLLREKMKVLIADNTVKYNSSVARHTELLKLIEEKNLAISDLHNILKIVKTLPLIEKYQRDNLPDTKSLEGFVKKQDEAIKLADTLIKR